MAIETLIPGDQEVQEVIQQLGETQQVEETLPEEFFVYEKAKPFITNLLGEWSSEFQEAKTRRLQRYIDLDVEQLRESGEIAQDETFIPDRVIDNNITREIADIMAFLNAGQRIGIFRSLDNPKQDTRQLEDEFTKGLTYSGWYREFNRVADGALLHKQDYIEVLFDETKPLNVAFEHIGYDKLYYNMKCSSIQDSERVIREYEMTINKLEDFVKNGFDANVVAAVTENKQEGAKRLEIQSVYKVYFRYNNCVYICWFIEGSNVNNWLKAPEKLKLGIYNEVEGIDPMTGQPAATLQEAEIDIYPIFNYLYRDDEQEVLTDHKGRAFLDEPQQEANTAIISAFVNGAVRASSIYASPKNESGTESGEIKQLDIQLVPDGIYDTALEFFSKPYPDVTMLTAIQLLSTKNSEQTGKIAAAVSNRKDSRKTAKELSLGSQEEQKITSTRLATFSEFLRNLLTFAWRIVQSQAIQGHVSLVQKEVGTDSEGRPIFENDFYVIAQNYDVRPAGDTDVIEAENERIKLQQDWPVFQAIPGLKESVLEVYIKLCYPKHADKFIAAMKQGDIGKNLVAALSAILQQTTSPEEVAALPPQDQTNLQNIQMQVQQYLSMNQAAPAA
jgi:hypothetical protein